MRPYRRAPTRTSSRLPITPREGRLRRARSSSPPISNPILADAILVVHAAFVLFVVGGFAAILAGIAFKRPFAFNPWLRGAHLAAIGFVAAESLLGYMCPLTLWEDALRGNEGGPGFIQRWIHAWLFWDVPASFFTPVYVAFLLAVIWSWLRYPPRRRYEG